MMTQTMPPSSWNRLFIRDKEDLRRQLAGLPIPVKDWEAMLVVPTLRVEDGRLVMPELLVWFESERLVTAEPQGCCACFDTILERVARQHLDPSRPHHVLLVLLQSMLDELDRVLSAVSGQLSMSHDMLQDMLKSLDSDRASGVSDLQVIDERLVAITRALSAAAQSLAAQSHAARLLRRAMLEAGHDCPASLNLLIAEQERVTRRVEFLLDRQRTDARIARETIAHSDLTVTKVFTVLWAIFIPGTAIINWYGQNFRFMPELSWDGSLWVQLAAAFLLTVIPIYVVRMSGALR